MNKPKIFTPKFIENAVRFAVYFLAVAITPLLGSLTAFIWDWVAYSMLRELFAHIHTAFFWLFEVLLFRWICNRLRKKEILPPLAKKRREKGEAKERPAPMPLKNLWILTGICVVCIFLVSAIIGFKVKPFYDLGEKITGYQLWNAVGRIGLNIFRCMWIVAMLRCAKRMAEELVNAYLPQAKPIITWLIAGSILMIFGLFDIFVSVVRYPMNGTQALLALAYFLFYIAFTAIYYFTEEKEGKTFLLVAFIYLF